MAAKKLYGAAAAAHARKHGRTARTSTALAKTGPRTITKTKTKTRTIVLKAKRRSGGGGGRGRGIVASLKAQQNDLIAGIGYGWVRTGKVGNTAADKPLRDSAADLLDKLPVFETVGKPASHGFLLALLAENTSGEISKWSGHLSHAALMRAADNFGASDFKLDEMAKLGDDDDGDDEVGSF